MGPVKLGKTIRTPLRLLFMLAVLVAVALASAITTIRLSIRGRQESMPQLVGAPLEAAEKVIADRGLTLKVEDKVYSGKYGSGQIVSQQPSPGTTIKVGQHVHVLVSLGPPRVKIPDLTNSSFRAAQISAIQRGLSVRNIATVPWPGKETGKVVAQDPSAAATDIYSPAINLLVSGGEPPTAYLCPNFVGRPIAAIRKELEDAKLKVGDITPIPTTTAPKGAVLFQSPPPGSKIGPDAVFTFQVAE
ncbi:MAG: PASTA domain-containing protein [Acidobacteria bacterium]|nr:PASTA domain-containing protein [Acidobacteriota bacterium]